MIAHSLGYRPPDWGVPASQREQLRSLVADALTTVEPVAVTHAEDAKLANRLTGGFRIGDHYRPQLELMGSITPGEDLTGAAFASLEFRPRGSTAPVRGIERYGDVAINWTPRMFDRASITPILSGTVDQATQYAKGLQAGTIADLPDIVTDTLIMQHSDQPLHLGTREWLPNLLAAPRADALAGVRELLTGPAFHRITPEVIIRGIEPSRQSIEALSMLTPSSSAERRQVVDWAQTHDVRLVDNT